MTEEKIIELLAQSENYTKAYEAVVDLYQKRLYWHIRTIVLSHDDADDVLQNTFIKVWKGLKNFRGDSKLYTWLYRIATNEAVSFLQAEKKHTRFNISDNIPEAYLESDPYFDGDEAQLKFWAAVEKLPEKQKLIFKMKYFEDMKYTDISAILETSVGGLKASYHHAVNKIKEYLEKH